AAAMGSLGGLILAVAYGADYSRRWALTLMTVYCALIAAVVVYLIVNSIRDVAPERDVIVAIIAISAIVTLVLIPRNSFKLFKLKESVFLTARTTSMVCWLFIGSFTFSAVFAYL